MLMEHLALEWYIECTGGLQLRVGLGESGSESKEAWRFVRRGCYGFWRCLVIEYAGSRPFRGRTPVYRAGHVGPPRGHRGLESSVPGWQLDMNGNSMKKNKRRARPLGSDEDTMRPEYDFSKAVRGVTAARYAEGTNVVLLDPDVAEIFPDTRAVNEALRTIARLTRTTSRKPPRKRTA